MPELPIYLDHHATTPVDPRVVEAMLPFFSERFGNASSRHHAFGWVARDAVAAARRQVAELIGADPREICFTSGATESDNLAIRGVVAADSRRPLHVVTMTTEHHAVLDPCRRLEGEGVEVSRVAPRPDGLCDPAAVERALRPHTRLVSVMAANNEIGVLQPMPRIAELTQPRGIVLHTDAAQAVGKVAVDVDALGVDLLSLTAHKMCGPKGIGALYVRRRRPRLAIEPLVDGGGHEQGLRSGTLNVPGIVGFGAAAALCRAELDADGDRVGRLRDRLLAGLRDRLGGVSVNGSLAARLPHNLNVSFEGVEGESLLVGLDDVAVSSGAACTSVNPEPSHVLKEIGVSDELARASIRFGLGRTTTEDDVDYALDKVVSLVTRLRQLSPHVLK
jgi:cysteine desulfurase